MEGGVEMRHASSEPTIVAQRRRSGQKIRRSQSFGASVEDVVAAQQQRRRSNVIERAGSFLFAPIRRMAIMRGNDVMVSNSLGYLPEFAERQQELTTLVRKMSSHIEIAPVERERFELELRNYHAADADDLARHFKSSLTQGLDAELAQVRLLNGGMSIHPYFSTHTTSPNFAYSLHSPHFDSLLQDPIS